MPSVTSTKETYMPKKITQEEFNARVAENYGTTLDTSKFVYTRYNGRGVVTCPVHGEYEVSAQNLLKGFKCSKCYHVSQTGRYKDSIREFVTKAREVHGNRYDYGHAIYRGAKRKLSIMCPEHGVFEQEAWSHLSGKGCSLCGDTRVGDLAKLAPEEFIRRAESIHGDTYDLSQIEYNGMGEKIKIVCKVHGPFMSKAGNFIYRKSGCPKCKSLKTSERSRRSLQSYADAGTLKHSGKFTYVGLTYLNQATYLTVICPKHGEFRQLAQDHLKGIGCVKCSKPVFDQQSFLLEALATHGVKYDYSNSVYTGAVEKVRITCPIHGDFLQAPTYHVNMSNGCPRCAGVGPSSGQMEIFEFLKTQVEVVSESALTGSKKRFDILIPSKNLAVEYHGLIWHSTAFAPDPLKDSVKHKDAASMGIRVIHVYQDEWLNQRPVVERMLLSALGKLPKISARKTDVTLLDNRAANEFYRRNHLQGPTTPAVSFGLYHLDILVAAMSFAVCRSIRTNTDKGLWELQRYSSSTTVVGGAGRLLKHFLDLGLCHTLVSYSDTRLFTGNMYEQIGFTLAHETEPDYCYVSSSIKAGRIHKSKFQRKHLPSRLANFDPDKTEVENCFNNGWYQLFDCGKKKWVLIV